MALSAGGERYEDTREHVDEARVPPDARMRPDEEGSGGEEGCSRRKRGMILGFVALLFVVLLVGKGFTTGDGEGITSSQEDPVAAYQAALADGKPTYVLFHSLTCRPCVEISEVADKVVPDYEGAVTFVNVITDDRRAQPLYAQFSFQYIPTSFFLDREGRIFGQHTGVLTEEDMRRRLDRLVASR